MHLPAEHALAASRERVALGLGTRAGIAANGRHSGVAVTSARRTTRTSRGTRVIASRGGIQPERMPARIVAICLRIARGSASRRFR
jgi:hypothetical protein